MHNLQTHINNYLNYCNSQKRLDEKTIKAYRIDLRQFSEGLTVTEIVNPQVSAVDSLRGMLGGIASDIDIDSLWEERLLKYENNV
ncbi:MAG: site-specific integrase [Lachnospiraceae bacterium]|nr:site-specific integrase [Lachnospiraceae bacterium]